VAKTRVGVDVGSTAVRVAEVAAGDVPVVVRAAQVPLPPGAVEAGEVREPEAVAEALRELWGKAGVKSKQVYLGVGNQRVVVREVAIPWLPEKELRETLASRCRSSSRCPRMRPSWTTTPSERSIRAAVGCSGSCS